jgi:hypothetical protein
MEQYRIDDMLGSLTIDKWVFLGNDEKEKTREQFREEFKKKWGDNLVTAFPIPQEGETMQELVEKRELYQRSHVELYCVQFNPHGDSERVMQFTGDAKCAGLQIEAAIPIDTSKPWYRRILRREPREISVNFVIIAPPRSVSQTK